MALPRRAGELHRRRARTAPARNVVGQLNNAFQTLGNEPPEREDEPLSAAYRRGLCLAEFMRLHFWMANLEPDTGQARAPALAFWAFGDLILPEREAALNGLDVGEGGIEYAALVMADAATDALLEHHKKDDPRSKLAAARSTVLMLCDAGIIVPRGFPGGVQWLYPVADLKSRPRRNKRQIPPR